MITDVSEEPAFATLRSELSVKCPNMKIEEAGFSKMLYKCVWYHFQKENLYISSFRCGSNHLFCDKRKYLYLWSLRRTKYNGQCVLKRRPTNVTRWVISKKNQNKSRKMFVIVTLKASNFTILRILLLHCHDNCGESWRMIGVNGWDCSHKSGRWRWFALILAYCKSWYVWHSVCG
jgi:hypothetical protein